MEKSISLKAVWKEFKERHPKTRIRDAARILGVSEAELVATGAGETAIRLKPAFKAILKEAESLGYVMALTRNDHCVHERKGVYKKVTFNTHVGLAVNPDIDLRIFINRWKFGFAVNENDRLSLQFFGRDGSAIHKIYLTEQSDQEAYWVLVKKYRAEVQDEALNTSPLKPADSRSPVSSEKPDREIDAEGFRAAWLELKDTHDFFQLLRSYGVTRTQGLRLAPEGYAQPTTIEAVKKAFALISEREVEIMVFTGNTGIIQIHTGKAKNLLQTGPWFNVLDPEFNLHLRAEAIASAWLVRKPTEDGGHKTTIHSLELYDSQGSLVVQLFGKRKPGVPESEAWRKVLRECIGCQRQLIGS